MKVSLEKWAAYGWLRAEPATRDEIKALLLIVNRDLADASIAAISDDRRFEAAFNAARTAANVALRACGYRTATQVGHHLKTIESMELTIACDPAVIHRMRVFSKKRNATSYDTAGNITKQELATLIATAKELHDTVLAWLRLHHPQLL